MLSVVRLNVRDDVGAKDAHRPSSRQDFCVQLQWVEISIVRASPRHVGKGKRWANLLVRPGVRDEGPEARPGILSGRSCLGRSCKVELEVRPVHSSGRLVTHGSRVPVQTSSTVVRWGGTHVAGPLGVRIQAWGREL